MRYKNIFGHGDFINTKLNKIPCESIHNSFCRYLLGVYKSCSNTLCKQELGRLPVSYFIIVQTIKYWNHILMKQNDSLLYQCYTTELISNSAWTTFIKDILLKCGFDLNWERQIPINEKDLPKLKYELRKLFMNGYFSAKRPVFLNSFCDSQVNKTSHYIKLADYLRFNIPLKYKKTITRVRLQSLKLGIVTGRYTRPKTPVEQRLCAKCSEIDDEAHLILSCQLTEQIRNIYHQLLGNKYPHFLTMSDYEKVQFIINPSSGEDALICGKFLMQLLESRQL